MQSLPPAIWTIAAFPDLPLPLFYQIAALRQEVFIVEQQCIFPDLDFKDQPALHHTCVIDGVLAAYARIFLPGVLYEPASIGRIITAPAFRGTGLGRVLVQKSIDFLNVQAPAVSIRIAAQVYLQDFYASFGFLPVSEPYLEDGIPHIDMLRLPV